MKIHVFDTHVRTTAGQYLHFDVLVDDQHTKQVNHFVGSYLNSKGIQATELQSTSCQFCHSEIANPEVQTEINANGHYILPLSGC